MVTGSVVIPIASDSSDSKDWGCTLRRSPPRHRSGHPIRMPTPLTLRRAVAAAAAPHRAKLVHVRVGI